MSHRGNDAIQGQDVEMKQDPTEMSAQHLANMFHQNMSLSNDAVQNHDNHDNHYQTIPPVETQQQQSPFKYSNSQHYTHSSHVVQALHPLQPPKQDVATHTLIKNGISPSSLLRSQLALFEGADEGQRARLVELWRIVPPTYARNGGQEMADRLGEYQSTTLMQEEELAQLRYLRESRTANEPSRRSEGILQPAFGYLSSPVAPGRSLEGNGNWSKNLSQQVQYSPGRSSQQSIKEDVDEDTL